MYLRARNFRRARRPPPSRQQTSAAGPWGHDMRVHSKGGGTLLQSPCSPWKHPAGTHQAPIRGATARFLFSGRWWQAAGAGGPRWEGSGERALAAGAHPSLFLSTWRKATRQSSIESLFSRRSCRTRDWTFTSCRSSHTRLKFCAGQGSRTQAVSFACRSHWGSAGAPLGFQSIWLGRAGTLPTVESGIARKKRPPIMQSTQKSCPTKRSQSQATVHQSHRRAKSLEGYRKGAWGLIDGGASEVPSTNHSGPVRPR